MKRISVVVPLFNEAGSLKELYERVKKTFTHKLPDYEWELIYCNDGSTDASRTVISQIQDRDPHVGSLHFTRNFGQHPALLAGLKAARGQYVILMDSDLQNPPEEIPKLVAKIEQGYDLVYGVREKRRDSLVRRVGSWFFHTLLNYLLSIDMKDVGSAYRILSRKLVDEFVKIPNQGRHPLVLMAWMGYRSASVTVEHDARVLGRSNYNLYKTIKMTAELVMGFSPRVLRLITWIGLSIAAVSFMTGSYFIFNKLFFGGVLPGFTSLVVLITFFFGVSFIFLGIISEFIAKIFLFGLARPPFVVDEYQGCLGRDARRASSQEGSRYEHISR